MIRISLSLWLFAASLLSLPVVVSAYTVGYPEHDMVVKLTPTKGFANVVHKGRPVRITRRQDQNHLLEKDYTRTSRACPPFCIQPMAISPDIKTLGELELIDFLQQVVVPGSGLLVDVRMPRFYEIETIPGAVNIPFLLLTTDVVEVLPLLGAIRTDTGWDYQNAKSLLVFCNGAWCPQSGRAIEALLSVDYPREKLQYYRGGMQMWKLFGLSTVGSAVVAER